MTNRLKPVTFLGDSLSMIRSFPESIKRQAGYQLDRVQRGLEPLNWKVMQGLGAGVQEIRLRDNSGAFRIIYVAKLKSKVVVLHAFQKKTQKTSQHDLELAKYRYKQIMLEEK